MSKVTKKKPNEFMKKLNQFSNKMFEKSTGLVAPNTKMNRIVIIHQHRLLFISNNHLVRSMYGNPYLSQMRFVQVSVLR